MKFASVFFMLGLFVHPATALSLTHAVPVVDEGRHGESWSVVAIDILDASGASLGSCTGALIGPRTVLTAAHCFDKSLLFTSDHLKIAFFLTPGDAQKTVLPVVAFVPHPLYKAKAPTLRYDYKTPVAGLSSFSTVTMELTNDVAVLSFSGRVPPGFVAAKLESDPAFDLNGKVVDMFGYGWGMKREDMEAGKAKTSAMMQANLLRHGRSTIEHYDDFHMLYFNSDSPTESQVCNSDSGGPQFFSDGSGPRIVGINAARLNRLPVGDETTSAAQRVAERQAEQLQTCGDASIAMEIAPFYDWIVKTRATLESEQ